MEWENFNADRVDPVVQDYLSQERQKLLSIHPFKGKTSKEIKVIAKNYITEFYEKNLYDELNETRGVSIFRPSEFSNNLSNEQSLSELQRAISNFKFNWRNNSQTVQNEVNSKYQSAGKTNIPCGDSTLILDSLVKIQDRRVAIEYETSNNVTNGYLTLKLAIKQEKADYGVMIVPWHEKASGRANQSIATSQLDHGFNEIGPIYRMAIVRALDIYKELEKYGSEPKLNIK